MAITTTPGISAVEDKAEGRVAGRSAARPDQDHTSTFHRMKPSPSVPLLVAVLGTLLSGGDAAVVQPRGAAMGGAGAMTRNHLSALRSRSSHIMCVMSADAGQQLSKASAAAPEGAAERCR